MRKPGEYVGVTDRDRLGRTALPYAAADGDADGLRVLAGGAAPEVADVAGWTPLHFAAQVQTSLAIEALLAVRATVDAADVRLLGASCELSHRRVMPTAGVPQLPSVLGVLPPPVCLSSDARIMPIKKLPPFGEGAEVGWEPALLGVVRQHGRQVEHIIDQFRDEPGQVVLGQQVVQRRR